MHHLSATAVKNYIANLPIGEIPAVSRSATAQVNTIDMTNLPDGVVTGSNLIQFPPDASAGVRSAVALSILAAQRVAKNDKAILTPGQWVDRHNTVLQNLNWLNEGGNSTISEFKNINVAVHEAIIPFLTAAFGGAVAAGALIITALQKLKDMDKDDPWITLFDQESQHFDVTEYQFSTVQVNGNDVTLKLASARLDASYGKTQVLFVKIKNQKAQFEQASQTLSAQADVLEQMNADLTAKLSGLTKKYIQSLPDDLLAG